MEKITIEALIKNALESRIIDIHTCIPCVVDSVQSDTVDVTVAVKRVNDDGSAFTVPTIPDVPVMFYGNETLSIAHQILVGDEGLLIFCERDISSFLENGKIAKPVILRKHEYSDAVFIPVSISNGKRAQIPSSGIELNGDVKVNGNISASGEVTAISDGSSVGLSTHTHIDSQGGPTQPPTGGT